jgi:hypothetical protein
MTWRRLHLIVPVATVSDSISVHILFAPNTAQSFIIYVYVSVSVSVSISVHISVSVSVSINQHSFSGTLHTTQ